MPKKDKKNAREASGIAAAVTKQTAGKFSTNNSSSSNLAPSKNQPASNESTPPINTPEVLGPSSVPDHVNQAPSPMLEALSNASATASTAPSMTNEWARGGAGGFAGSPGNLISLMGDSPPTQPSSYEDSSRGRLHQGWAAQRAFKSSSPASPSPPNRIRRPLSYQMESHLQNPDSMPQASPPHYRRSSLQSHISRTRRGSQPPLPHQPQPHFYGAPDLDLTLTPDSGMKAGDRGYFFGFDQLPAGAEPAGGSGNVVLAGYEGGLDVYSVSKKGLEPMGSLKGLHGGVIHAKILPWTVTDDPQELFPLVAVVLHGPVLPSSSPDEAAQAGNYSPRMDGAASPRSAFGQEPLGSRQQSAKSYATVVQVYSLRTNKLIDTLLKAPEMPINPVVSLTSPIFQPPLPGGAFSIKADGGTVVVCSGISGECWAFMQLLEPREKLGFGCVGKLWTCLQPRSREEVSEEGDKGYPFPSIPRPANPTPILDVNGRWIAYCPSLPSSHLTLNAQVSVSVLGRSNSVNSLTPPQLPSSLVSVDLISSSFVNKIMRETTQELISGAKWFGQQGMQAWNSYWNKPTSPQPQLQQGRSQANQFPPTHSTTTQPTPKEPGIVSIVDAEMLPESHTVTPVTSFAPPQGCSFLSFAPSSLALFTASSKGDVQNVWDLLRVQYTKSSPLQATLSPNEAIGPHVRQIAQFSRMTVARIIDVTWSEPHGERIAVVTERGTVHLLEMPFSAFMWPPPRRRKAVQEVSSDTNEPPPSAVSLATGAFGAAYQAAMPFVSRSRRGSVAPPTGPANTLKESAAHGGRAIAASITNSLGKTGTAINQFRQAGENRVSLPSSTYLPIATCVKWVRGRKSHTLFALGNGIVRIFPNRTRRASTHSNKRGGRSSRYTDIKMPALPDYVVAEAVRQIMDSGVQDEVLDLSDREMDAGNTLTLNRDGPRPVSTWLSLDDAIPQTEVDPSAPYQPFHTDRRVTLCHYNEDASSHLDGLTTLLANTSMDERSSKKGRSKQRDSHPPVGAFGEDTAWAFGQDIPVTRIEPVHAHSGDESFDGSDDQALPPSAMERVMQYGDHEQIVVTTRKRRTVRHGDIDGFFEDDCEVLDFADQRV